MLDNERFAPAFLATPDSRKFAKDRVRQILIPSLSGTSEIDYEQTLLTLHRATTEGVELARDLQGLNTELVYGEVLAVSVAYGDEKFGKRARKVRAVIAGTSDIEIHLPQGDLRGCYRLLGDIYRKGPGGLELVERVFSPIHQHQYTENLSFIYEPPYKNIDLLMEHLCSSFRRLEARSPNDPTQVALRAAFFYAVGNKLIHPFVDGHHRTFDMFLELTFKRAGLNLVLPEDEEGNVPSDHPLRFAIGKVIVNFLLNFHMPVIETNSWNGGRLPHTYQNNLVKELLQIVKDPYGSPALLYPCLGIAEQLLIIAGQDEHAHEVGLKQAKLRKRYSK